MTTNERERESRAKKRVGERSVTSRDPGSAGAAPHRGCREKRARDAAAAAAASVGDAEDVGGGIEPAAETGARRA